MRTTERWLYDERNDADARQRCFIEAGDQHWQMLAKGAMLDDLSGLQRSITSSVLDSGGDVESPAELVEAWQANNGRTIERAGQLLGELRAVPAPDAAMLSVALRELRGLT